MKPQSWEIECNPPSYLGGTDDEWIDGFNACRQELLNKIKLCQK
jgi:hypothetical protein